MTPTHARLALFAGLFGRMASRHHIEGALRAATKPPAPATTWKPKRDADLRSLVAAQNQRHQAQTGRAPATTAPRLAMIRGGAR